MKEYTTLGVRVPAELAEKAKRKAEIVDTTISRELRRILREFVADFPEQPVPELLRDDLKE